MAILLDCDETTMRKQLATTADSREDGTPEAISARIQTYKHQTLPVLGHLDDLGKLAVVNGEQSEDDVMDEVLHVFKRCTLDSSSSMLAVRPVSDT